MHTPHYYGVGCCFIVVVNPFNYLFFLLVFRNVTAWNVTIQLFCVQLKLCVALLNLNMLFWLNCTIPIKLMATVFFFGLWICIHFKKKITIARLLFQYQIFFTWSRLYKWQIKVVQVKYFLYVQMSEWSMSGFRLVTSYLLVSDIVFSFISCNSFIFISLLNTCC